MTGRPDPAQHPDIFERLQGEWTFVREVPGKASMTGRARIVPTGEGRARYDETARVRLADGKTLTGSQSYRYRRLPLPANGFDVLFAENEELFERLEFRAAPDEAFRANAEHHCPPDHYVSQFTLDREDRLVVEHTVRGPRKDYVVRTAYRKVARARNPRRSPSSRQL
ncbi:MAG TPA: DUF6314 family protein [Acidobacteriaceae bacterium]|jgi:hypothetical protein|nr:DUF6314 family protein [Acidobacteriaceae bacterium]